MSTEADGLANGVAKRPRRTCEFKCFKISKHNKSYKLKNNFGPLKAEFNRIIETDLLNFFFKW